MASEQSIVNAWKSIMASYPIYKNDEANLDNSLNVWKQVLGDNLVTDQALGLALTECLRKRQERRPNQGDLFERAREIAGNHPRILAEKMWKVLTTQSTNTADPAKVTVPVKPKCTVCGGAGYLRRDVPVEHPDFGKLVVCDCKRQEVHSVSEHERMARDLMRELYCYEQIAEGYGGLARKNFIERLTREIESREAVLAGIVQLEI